MPYEFVTSQPLLPVLPHDMVWSSLVMIILNYLCPSCHLEQMFREGFLSPSAFSTLQTFHSCALEYRGYLRVPAILLWGALKPGDLGPWRQVVGSHSFSSFLSSAALVSFIYTSKKLTLLNEIALQITSSAWNVILYKCCLTFWPPDFLTACLLALEEKTIELDKARAASMSSVQSSELRQSLLLIGSKL